MMALTVGLGAAATVVAYLCGRSSGWLQGWRDCQQRGLYDKGYERGWRDRVAFEEKGGAQIPTPPEARA